MTNIHLTLSAGVITDLDWLCVVRHVLGNFFGFLTDLAVPTDVIYKGRVVLEFVRFTLNILQVLDKF